MLARSGGLADDFAVMKDFARCLLAAVAACTLFAPSAGRAQVGYGEGATGGGNTTAVTVTTADELRAALAAPGPGVVRIRGKIQAGSVAVGSDKTVEGEGPAPTLRGSLVVNRGTSNVIIRNLILSNPKQKKNSEGYDGITVRGGRKVWIDHCTFQDCGDGSADVTNGADNVTISWCKFEYSSDDLKHRFVMLADGPKKGDSKNGLKLTLHHNWFAENCGARMPAARRSRVHLFNNFFDTGEGVQYATLARDRSEILSESNYYRKVKNPSYTEEKGRLRRKGDVFEQCSGKRSDGKDDVFAPPYSYRPDPAGEIPRIVSAGAGCPL